MGTSVVITDDSTTHRQSHLPVAQAHDCSILRMNAVEACVRVIYLHCDRHLVVGIARNREAIKQEEVRIRLGPVSDRAENDSSGTESLTSSMKAEDMELTFEAISHRL